MSINSFLNNASKTISKKLEVAEVDIEDNFVKHAKNKKCKALKLRYLNKKGFPDRTVCCPGGRIFFIEFKRKNKKQTAPQKIAQKLLEGLGFEYHVCDKIGQAEAILDDFLEWV